MSRPTSLFERAISDGCTGREEGCTGRLLRCVAEIELEHAKGAVCATGVRFLLITAGREAQSGALYPLHGFSTLHVAYSRIVLDIFVIAL